VYSTYTYVPSSGTPPTSPYRYYPPYRVRTIYTPSHHITTTHTHTLTPHHHTHIHTHTYIHTPTTYRRASHTRCLCSETTRATQNRYVSVFSPYLSYLSYLSSCLFIQLYCSISVFLCIALTLFLSFYPIKLLSICL
jgi:hypothetical protein